MRGALPFQGYQPAWVFLMPSKILVVDDETDLEDLLLQWFRPNIRKGKYEFRFAHDGKEALEVLERRLVASIVGLASFAEATRAIPTLAYTHLQPAQLTTFGKRACLWLQDLYTDFVAVRSLRLSMRCRGTKGTTGTQASYLSLFEGDHEKVRALDRKVATKLGFDAAWPVTGQTYPRKQDSQTLAVLAGRHTVLTLEMLRTALSLKFDKPLRDKALAIVKKALLPQDR